MGFGYFQNKIFDLKGNIYSRQLIENTLALSLLSLVYACARAPGSLLGLTSAARTAASLTSASIPFS